MYDVAIVGAGPAGLCCAIICAQNGLKVALIEKQNHPRIKVCGGGVVKRAFKACPVDITPAVEQTISQVDLIWHQSKLHLKAKQATPIIYMVQRKILDNLLLESALNQKINYYPNTTITQLDQQSDSIKLSSKTQTIEAFWVVGADGASGSTAKLAGFEPLEMVPAVDAEIKIKETNHNLKTRFDFDVIKRGYGWVFPKAEHYSIGVVSFNTKSNSKQSSLNQCLSDYLNYLNLTEENIISFEKRGFVIPIKPRDKLTKGRVLLIGDAAGLADPLTAEGISGAIISGNLAAQALSQSSHPIETYQTVIKDELLIDLKVSQQLGKLLYNNPRLAKFLLKLYPDKSVKALSNIFTGKKRFSNIRMNDLIKHLV